MGWGLGQGGKDVDVMMEKPRLTEAVMTALLVTVHVARRAERKYPGTLCNEREGRGVVRARRWTSLMSEWRREAAEERERARVAKGC